MGLNSPFHGQGNLLGAGRVWEQLDGDAYLVTGLDRAGKRFRIKTSNWAHARGINVWRGSKWLVRAGKRYLVQRITN